jgi:hypothetical protein
MRLRPRSQRSRRRYPLWSRRQKVCRKATKIELGNRVAYLEAEGKFLDQASRTHCRGVLELWSHMSLFLRRRTSSVGKTKLATEVCWSARKAMTGSTISRTRSRTRSLP